MNRFQAGQRVTSTGHGLGTVLRPHGEYQAVVRWDDTTGFHGARPVIVWSYSLRPVG